MVTNKEYVLRVLEMSRGDDLARAQMTAKRGVPLDKEYGQSGQTLRQIIEGYMEHNHVKHDGETYAWVKSL